MELNLAPLNYHKLHIEMLNVLYQYADSQDMNMQVNNVERYIISWRNNMIIKYPLFYGIMYINRLKRKVSRSFNCRSEHNIIGDA